MNQLDEAERDAIVSMVAKTVEEKHFDPFSGTPWRTAIAKTAAKDTGRQ